VSEAREGALWEARAAVYLEQHGLEVIARGYRCRLGELDLVCRDARHLVVVEVRARGTTARVSALESIGPHKVRRIVRATRHFLMRNASWRNHPIRFDVVAFDGIDTPEPRVSWLRNAFEVS
jgi:putative endonuclease